MLIEAADTSSMPTGVVITASTDSDGDGLADIVEIQTYGTDPTMLIPMMIAWVMAMK